MNITVPTDIEHALVEQARNMETTPERLALDSLRSHFVLSNSETAPAEGDTLADFLSDFIGVLHSSEHVPGGANLSEASGKKFADILVKKRNRGHP